MTLGRPTKFEPGMIETARRLCSQGATDREVAQALGIAESTLYVWKHDNPEFAEALKVTKEAADERVISALYRRATGYSFDSEKISINAKGAVTRVPCVEHVPPDTAAAFIWLKNRQGWRDKVDHKHGLEDSLEALLAKSFED